MPTVLEAIGAFLATRKTACNADLVERWSPAMETQCNVKKGEPVEGRRNTQTDGCWTWWPIRIPKDADSEPHFRDYQLTWPPSLFVTDTRKTSVFIPGAAKAEQDEWDELSAAYPIITPDAIHQRFIDELHSRGWPVIYIPERNCYQTHVAGLAEVFEALKAELKLKGTFPTTSPGREKTEPNCFFFLRPNGALFVVRFGAQTAEDESWGKTANGWPCRDFNVAVDPRSVLDKAGVRGEKG